MSGVGAGSSRFKNNKKYADNYAEVFGKKETEPKHESVVDVLKSILEDCELPLEYKNRAEDAIKREAK